MNTILITGASGTVGSSICEQLVSRGGKYRLVGVYNAHEPSFLRRQGVSLVKCDLVNEQLPKMDADVIIHAAACLAGSSLELAKNNIFGTRNILKWATVNNVKRMIYISTNSIFGHVDGILTENTDIVNPDGYGMTKYLAERIVVESSIPEKLIIRLPRVLSPHMDLAVQYSGFVKMINLFLRDETVTCDIPDIIYNNYICADVLADFIDVQLNKLKWDSCVEVNLGATEDFTMIEVLSSIRSGMGSKSELIAKNMGNSSKCARVDIAKAMAMGLRKVNERNQLEAFAAKLKQEINKKL